MVTENFISLRIAVLIISDTRNERSDKSGKILEKRILDSGHQISEKFFIKDDEKKIFEGLKILVRNKKTDVIILTGGTGLTGRDVTPEAVGSIFEKSIDGFGELFRLISFQKIGTSALQSRATAGVKNGKYIFCLPGSPSACKDAWDNILLFQLDIRHKPCNFVEILPRLKENELSRPKS